MRKRPRFLDSGKKSFPTSDYSNFPFNALLARYTLNLLPKSPFHKELIEMVVAVTGTRTLIDITVDLFHTYMSEQQMEDMLDMCDQSSLYHLLPNILERSGSDQKEAAFRSRLANAVKHNLPALPPDDSAYARRVERFKNLLGLSDEELQVLECIICYQIGDPFESYCDQYPVSDWIVLFAAALGLPRESVRRCMVKGGLLDSKGMLQLRSHNIETSDDVFDYLTGLSTDFLQEKDFALADGQSFPLNSFPVNPSDTAILLEALRSPSPCHFFFYGRPGTGKTELAKALATESGRQAFLVRYGDDGTERDRRGAITATINMAPLNSVVIIDEVDSLLNTGSPLKRAIVDKGWINNFMDGCQHKVIWISNESRCIDTSVLRRFSYSLEFKKFTAAQRESAWRTQLKGHPLAKTVSAPMVSRLAREYETDAGGIASALKAAESVFVARKPSSRELEQTLGRLLGHHEKLSGVTSKKDRLSRISANYDAAALNTDFSAAELLSSLKVRDRKIENGQRPSSANILFWGLPGTGKTEFAKYIAQELGKELLIKRMSDLQSMYVGQTEKQIAAAFEEAGREGAILFLDEVDSLILDRNTATRSWESSQTNEVLTQIENFYGICICCTNLLDSLDEAALRRFTWKMKFLPLTDEGKEKLFRKYFQPRGRLAASVQSALREIRDLTPGDFKTVDQTAQYRAEKPDPAEYLELLKKEVSYKRSRSKAAIGF